MVTALSEIRKQNMKALLVIDIQNSYLNSQKITEVEIIGVDGNSCIKASAKGAVKCGFLVSILLSCVGVSNLPRFEKTKENLEKSGVMLINN